MAAPHRIQRVTPQTLPRLLPDILVIEALSFPRPWGAEEFAADLSDAGGLLEVVLVPGPQPGGRVAAFCSCRQLADELHVMQIATHPEARRHGYGGELLARALCEARRRGLTAVLLEVRPSNRPAVALYEKHGFRAVGRRRAYYADNGEDALIMRCDLDRP